MSSVVRLSRFSKAAVVTAAAAGGTLYVYRNEIKPYLRGDGALKSTQPKNVPPSSGSPKAIEPIANLPEQVPYLLVGGGTASHSAMRAIRGHDPKAKVLIIGSENHSPYMRPALSKELWFSDVDLRRNYSFKSWSGKERSIFYEIDEFFIPLEKLESRETGGVSLIKNTRLERLDPDNRTAHLETGQTIKYDKCLLAPGGKPKTLPVLDAATDDIKRRTVYFRTAEDFLRLEKISGEAKRIVIIGGGFLGSELACALTNRDYGDNNKPEDQIIYQVFPESGNLGKILPKYLSEWLSQKIIKSGAQVIPNVDVKKVSLAADRTIEIELSNGEKINADYIVCAVGMEPDVELARASGLEVDERTGGYLVNSELEARTNVWVAGDASCFYDIKLGRRRVEHHDHAINSGKLAGQNMTGAGRAYTHQSMFWSDLGTDVSFEAMGIIDSSLKTVAVFADPSDLATLSPSSEAQPEAESQKASGDTADDSKAESLATTAAEAVEGQETKESVEETDKLTIARRILNEQKKYEDLNEVAKLFNIYLDE